MITISLCNAVTFFIIFGIVCWLYLSTDKELRERQVDDAEEELVTGIAVFYGEKTGQSLELLAEIVSNLNANELTRIRKQKRRDWGIEFTLQSDVKCYVFDHWRGIEGALPPLSVGSIFVDDSCSAIDMARIYQSLLSSPSIYFY